MTPVRKLSLIGLLIFALLLIVLSTVGVAGKPRKETPKKVTVSDLLTPGKKERQNSKNLIVNETNALDFNFPVGNSSQPKNSQKEQDFRSYEKNEDKRRGSLNRLRRSAGDSLKNEPKSGKKAGKKFKVAENEGKKERKKEDTVYSSSDPRKFERQEFHARHDAIDEFVRSNGFEDRVKSPKSKRETVLARSNATDYHAQRKAVMDRFYARQREIRERYADRTTSPFKYDLNYGQKSNETQTSTERIALSKPLKYDLNYGFVKSNESQAARLPSEDERTVEGNGNVNVKVKPATEAATEVAVRKRIDFDDFKPDLTGYLPDGNNIERNALDYDEDESSEEEKWADDDSSDQLVTNGTNNWIWGKRNGTVVYQHNFNLGIKGPSTLETTFEVIIEAHICITAVELIRYNDTRAMVSLHSGGPGYNYVRLLLKGYKNEGFSYIVKVWAVRKIGGKCPAVSW